MDGLEYIVIIACIVIVVVALSKRNVVSRSKLEEMYDEYTFLADSYNDVIYSTRDVCARMVERYFKSEADSLNTRLLVEQQQSILKQIKIACDNMAESIEEKDVKRHQILTQKINNYLEEAISNCAALSDICEDMLTKEEFEAQKREEEARKDERAHQTHQDNASNASIFFSGCDDRDQVEKRYKALAKVYHPDMPTGNEETFKLINLEYERRMRI